MIAISYFFPEIDHSQRYEINKVIRGILEFKI